MYQRCSIGQSAFRVLPFTGALFYTVGMPTLTVVMIVRNEAHCLGECLGSVSGIADGVLVGDTGSTDGTKELARSLGARVIDVPWTNDFAAARNAVLSQAEGDWLLHLDADEVVDAAGARRIREVVNGDGLGADAIEVILANYCDEPRAWRWVPVAPDDVAARGFSGYVAAPLLRLFRNGRGYEYREPVHENITESVCERGGVVRAEPILIHHYGYRGDHGRDQAKTALYLTIARAKIEQRPHDPKTWHDLAELLFASGAADEAESACRQALSLEPLHLGAATMLANVLLNRGVLDEPRALFERLAAAGLSAAHIPLVLGAIACRQGRLPEARHYLETALQVRPPSPMARYYLARVLDRLGDPVRAQQQLLVAVENSPRIEEFRRWLASHQHRVAAEQAFTRGDVQGALEGLVEALRLEPEDPLVHQDLGVVLETLGDMPRAAQSYARARQLAPDLAVPAE